jgi:hypothetical protein
LDRGRGKIESKAQPVTTTRPIMSTDILPDQRTAQARHQNLVSDLTRRIKRRSTYLRVNRWRARNPDRQRALSAVARALQDFNLDKKPCENCGTDRNVCADPISVKPLRVVWRCRCCTNALRRRSKTD